MLIGTMVEVMHADQDVRIAHPLHDLQLKTSPSLVCFAAHGSAPGRSPAFTAESVQLLLILHSGCHEPGRHAGRLLQDTLVSLAS